MGGRSSCRAVAPRKLTAQQKLRAPGIGRLDELPKSATGPIHLGQVRPAREQIVCCLNYPVSPWPAKSCWHRQTVQHPESIRLPTLCHCQHAHPAVNRYLKTTLLIARFAGQRWTVPAARRTLPNLRRGLRKFGRVQNLSSLRRQNLQRPDHLPLRPANRQDRHQPRPRDRRQAPEQQLMKTIHSGLGIHRQPLQRFRLRKSLISHACIKSSVRCVNRSASCQNLPSAKISAAPTKSAWCLFSKPRSPAGRRLNENPQGYPQKPHR